MAWMNQEKKKTIATALKAVIPVDWKWSLRVEHHSTLHLTIRSAPVDLIAAYNSHNTDRMNFHPATGSVQVNEYHLANQFGGAELELLQKIVDALNTGNHNRSDISSDYFDVGFYTGLHIGEWDKPFVHIVPVENAA